MDNALARAIETLQYHAESVASPSTKAASNAAATIGRALEDAQERIQGLEKRTEALLKQLDRLTTAILQGAKHP